MWSQLCPTIPTQRWFSSSVKYKEMCNSHSLPPLKVEREDNEIQHWKLIDLLPPVYHKSALLISIWERKKRLIMYISTLTMHSFKVVIWGCRWKPSAHLHDCLVYAFEGIFYSFTLRIFLSFQNVLLNKTILEYGFFLLKILSLVINWIFPRVNTPNFS